jgi:hypothetical protein
MRFFLPQVLHVRITDIHILQLRTCNGSPSGRLWWQDEEIADPIPCFRWSAVGIDQDTPQPFYEKSPA